MSEERMYEYEVTFVRTAVQRQTVTFRSTEHYGMGQREEIASTCCKDDAWRTVRQGPLEVVEISCVAVLVNAEGNQSLPH